MDREIKFRVWTGKKMCYQETEFLGSNGFIELATIYTGYYDSDEWVDYKVMQSTGLHDKNGTGIYEGDILEYLSDTEDTYRDVVKWEDSGFNLSSCGLHEGNVNCEAVIIGNIYENPELLESSHDGYL